jgi:hypothetical protein
MFVHVWKKYLPVIRILLKRSAVAGQAFNVDRFDFDKINRGSKPSCSFSIELNKGRLSALNTSVTGRDLVEVLKDDSICSDLLRNNLYTISLNSKFELQIKNVTPVEETAIPVQNDIANAETVPHEQGKDAGETT